MTSVWQKNSLDSFNSCSLKKELSAVSAISSTRDRSVAVQSAGQNNSCSQKINGKLMA